MRGDALPIHVGERRLWRPSHRDLVAASGFETARRHGRSNLLRQRVGVDIDALTDHAVAPVTWAVNTQPLLPGWVTLT